MKDHDFKYKKVRKQKYRSLICSNIHTCYTHVYHIFIIYVMLYIVKVSSCVKSKIYLEPRKYM